MTDSLSWCADGLLLKERDAGGQGRLQHGVAMLGNKNDSLLVISSQAPPELDSRDDQGHGTLPGTFLRTRIELCGHKGTSVLRR